MMSSSRSTTEQPINVRLSWAVSRDHSYTGSPTNDHVLMLLDVVIKALHAADLARRPDETSSNG